MFSRIIISAVALIFALLAETVAKPPADLFAQAPFMANVSVSADGKYFLARTANGAHRVFTVIEMGENPKTLIQFDEHEDLYIDWARWANNDTILIRFWRLGGPKVNIRVDGKTQRYRTRSASSLYALQVKDLYNNVGAAPIKLISHDGELVDILSDDPDHIIMQSSKTTYSRDVYKVNIRDLNKKHERVQRRVKDIGTWSTDRTGAVRVGAGYEDNGNRKFIARLQGENEFKDLSSLFDDIDERFNALQFAENPNQLYVLSNHETDTMALYLFDIATEKFLKQIYHNPSYDVSGVTTNDKTGALESVSFAGDEFETIWFDDEAEREIARLKRAFPEHDVSWRSFNANARFGIVSVSSPEFSGQLYTYDRQTREVSPLPVQYPGLETEKLGKAFAVSYEARDGEKIPAFVTLPPGYSSMAETKNIPFIILPHGGPAARDFKTFDLWAQFLATRGYGVLQMNFRGSTGYGLKYELAGRKQWGRLMQDDITDGVKWLTSEGFADKDRVSIFGASYGGYAALIAAALTPDIFQCSASFAGVTNLFDLVKEAGEDSYRVKLIGSRFKDNKEMKEFSPLFRVDDMEIPVLIIHGRLDGRVPYKQGEDLYSKMKIKRKAVEFLALPKTGHGLNNFEDRKAFYSKLEEFLSGCMN